MIFLALCMFFFAFSTIVGWYFSVNQYQYLFGAKSREIIFRYRLDLHHGWFMLKVDLVWALSDLFNGLMVIPNLLALLALSGLVFQNCTKRISTEKRS